MMHTNVLPGTTATGLKTLGSMEMLQQAYLAGGTAAALQLGHRISRDLDFFTDQPFDENIVGPALEDCGLQKIRLAWRTVFGEFNGVSFSYFYYKYPLLVEAPVFEGIRLAGLQDIAAMKIDAISTRGMQRDFIDLFAIMQWERLSLADTMELYRRKYGMQRDMVAHALRSLTYFDDAEDLQDRVLELLTPIDWEDVKVFFRGEVEKTSRKLLEE